MKRIFNGFSSALAALLVTTGAQAALLVDQQGATNYGGGVSLGIQSFTPARGNIAGIDVFLYSVAKFADGGPEIDYTANITLNLYTASGQEDFGYAANGSLLTDTFFLDTAGTREGWATLRFDPIALTPETFHIMELTTDNGVFAVAANDPYSRGQRLEPGIGRDYFDMRFVTYYDSGFSSVPLPAAAWLFGSAPLGLGVVKRRRA